MYCATITVAWCLRARMRMSSRTTSMRISSMDTSKRTRIFPLKVSADIDPEQGVVCLDMLWLPQLHLHRQTGSYTFASTSASSTLCVFFNFVAFSQNSKFMENSSLFHESSIFLETLVHILPKVFPNFARFQHVVLVLIGFHWKLCAVATSKEEVELEKLLKYAKIFLKHH